MIELFELMDAISDDVERLDAKFKTVRNVFVKFDEKIQDLEKRIAILESKPQESHLSRNRIDFDGADATKVPADENESDMERLKGLMQPRKPLPDFFE